MTSARTSTVQTKQTAITEHALMREQHYYDTLCNTGDGAFIVDPGRRIVRWNRGAEAILGHLEADVLNRECYRVISGKTEPDRPWCGETCKIHGCLAKGDLPKNFDLQTLNKDGAPVWLNVSVISPSDSDDPYIAHIIRDITKEKMTELALDQFFSDLGSHRRLPEGKPAERLPGERSSIPSSGALSSREKEVLTLLAEGLSTKSLAEKLSISHFTARNHIQNILVKLDLHSKAQAVSYAFKRGIL